MSEHRVRLDDSDIDVLLACLRARMAGTSGAQRARIFHLIQRFTDVSPGNPLQRFVEYSEDLRIKRVPSRTVPRQ